MDFKEFADQMEQDVRAALEDVSPGVTIRQEQISKLQGESYAALSVTPADSNIGMNINLNRSYEQMQSGASYDTVLDEAVNLATDHLDAGMPSVDVTKLTDYAKAKQLLCVEVVGTARNAEMLAKVPHTDMEDLSMVYRVQLGRDSRGIASVLVDNQMLEGYGVSREQLHEDALANAERMRPATIRTMREVLSGSLNVTEEMLLPDEAPPMYVVTNEDCINGAAAVFYPGFMEVAAQMLKSDYFILPSSVNEVLLLPDDGMTSAAELSAMVSYINREQVLPAERLSDHVYHYDAKARAFERGETYEARRDGKLSEKESRTSVLKDLQDRKTDTEMKPKPTPHRVKAEAVL